MIIPDYSTQIADPPPKKSIGLKSNRRKTRSRIIAAWLLNANHRALKPRGTQNAAEFKVKEL